MFYQVKETVGNPQITLMALFTREWMVDKWFESLEQLDIPWTRTQILVSIDSPDDSNLTRKVLGRLHLFSNANGILVFNSEKEPIGEWGDADDRRNRIIALKEKLKQHIKGELLFGLEDDTIIPSNTYRHLKSALDDDVGIVIGAQAGRWSFNALGVYKVRENDDKIFEIWTLSSGKGLEEIDGGGSYCFLTRSADFIETPLRNDKWSFLGQDFCYCYDLKKKGYKVLVDWDIDCLHYVEGGKIISSKDEDVMQCHWKKKDGAWVLLNPKLSSEVYK